MKTLFALLMLTTAAHAQTAPDFLPKNIIELPICKSPNGSCPLPDGIIRDINGNFIMLPSSTNGQLTTSTDVTISNKPRSSCEDGWTLVNAGRPMCARELREPKSP